MTVNQLVAISQSSFDFARAARFTYGLPSTASTDDCKTVVNADYAGGWGQFCFDCITKD